MNYFNWNWAVAEEEFKRALELNPNYATAHSQYAVYLVARGRINQALAEINRAQELDPLSLTISSSRGFILQNARRYEEAIEQLRRVIALDPNHYQANWFLAITSLLTSNLMKPSLHLKKRLLCLDARPLRWECSGLPMAWRGGKGC